MKKTLFLVSFLLLATTTFAQIQNGKVEVSASGSFGSYSTTNKSNNYSYDSDGITYLNTSFRLGYHISSGFEIEPELYSLFMEKAQPSFVISANILYNHNIADTKLYPFLLIGYGLGNSYPLLVIPNAYIRNSNKFNVGCINVGLGLKYFLNDYVGLRVEYRYQRYSHSYDDQYYYNTQNGEYKINSHSVLFGFSILL
jgi:hypothetical protein